TAIANKQRIVLPESTEPRTLTAADQVIAEGIADVILIGEPKEIMAKANELNLTHIGEARIVNPNDDNAIQKYAELFYELRKAKGITMEDAKKKAKDPLYLGCLLVKSGEADGQVAGAANSTGNVLRAAFQVIKTAPGISAVSGAFIMQLPEGSPYGHNGIFVFADCAAIPAPTASELAQIAVSANRTAKQLACIPEPKVAMLSFSTKGSAKHDNVTKVQEAVALAKENYPELLVDGEMQLDAALDMTTGQSKAPGSPVAGQANTLIFPSLEAGNIGYKLVQRLARAGAYGPVLQGLSMPVNDLSRGCFAEDIVGTVAITAVQAQNASK
ncbi:MAG: phosphate acetyltransferase, partial [Lachnospiraceae bacterium]|nr:phosphate acetyltransferase [Lachnospiraceae bacterium]